MKHVEIKVGDCIESMKAMPAQSVHTCVTSPPYFGLRDYGMDGQIGLEDTPDAFVSRLVEVFREVRRVLRDDGTLWLNLGDSYATGTKADRQQSKNPGVGANRPEAQNSVGRIGTPEGLKTKDLIGIPWRVAFALQADGWYLRQDIIWHKPNPMPESVTDRCTKAHEYVFLLSKSPRYYFDSEAMREPAVYPAGTKGAKGSASRAAEKGVNARPPEYKVYDGFRNRRSVWTVTTKPFKGAHFATFPPDLIEPCILAGCPRDGVVLDPFGGSGTTAGVAIKHGRKAVLCELNPEYAALVPERIRGIAGDTQDMLMEVDT
jgi:site-specific DNA-methyltransferase (adenine-specific)